MSFVDEVPQTKVWGYKEFVDGSLTEVWGYKIYDRPRL